MSPAAQPPSQPPDQAIETIYTTVEAQPDRTDWLTVVSNLRQTNRQLVEEIARLEEALASAKQSLHTHKEQNQIHEITILQQQEELSIAHDRVGALFQQLETSHQIGQRQQILIETLSQQLEIVQTIVPQIEAEHEQLRQKYHHQSQQLAKTEQVAVALHRRLKLPTNIDIPPAPATVAPTTSDASSPLDLDEADLTTQHTATETIASAQSKADRDLTDRSPTETVPSPLAPVNPDEPSFTTEIDPAPPLAPLDLPQRTSSVPTLAQTTISPPSKPTDPTSWRAAIATANSTIRYDSNLDPIITPSKIVEATDRDAAFDDPMTATSAANWPAPTLARTRPIAKPIKIDLPKFPKKPAG